MQLNKNNVSLQISAGRRDQLIKNQMPQFAFSGRSNVGKSSLINKLLNRKSLARVSSVPGKTVTINYYNVDNKIYLVDLPGYGFAQRSYGTKKSFSGITEGYFQNNGSLICVMQLIDIRVGITEYDAAMLDWLYETGTYFMIIATKADKLSKKQREEALQKIRGHEAVPDDVFIIPFSSQTGEGVETVWEEIHSMLEG